MGIKTSGAPNTTYHKEVIKQEDLSLVQSQLLGFIGVRNFKKPAVADQPSMGKREHLCRERHQTMVTCPQGHAEILGSLGRLGLHLPCSLPMYSAGSLTCHRELSVREEAKCSDCPTKYLYLSALFLQTIFPESTLDEKTEACRI